MEYKEITINITPDLLDATCDELTELGINGFVVESEEDFKNFLQNNRQYWDYVDEELENSFKNLNRIRLWVESTDTNLLKTIQSKYPQASVRVVRDSDWENNWRQYFKPIFIGKKTVVVPEWEEIPEGGRIPLILDPGLIFGTGSHPTTKMCLQSLEDYAMPGKKVLDLGCGSGILGIDALNLGCDSCVGVDIDPKAPDVVMHNASLNKNTIGKMKAYAGDVTTDKSLIAKLGTGYDIVLANIVADVIISLAPTVRHYMAEDGIFICSGIIDGREEEVKNTLKKNGFTIEKELHEDEWNAFICS